MDFIKSKISFAVDKPKLEGFIDESMLTGEPFALEKCPGCLREHLKTTTEQVASGRAVFATVLSFILLGPYALLGFMLIPLISHFMANIKHMCPVCGYCIGVAQNFTCAPRLQNDVVTIRIGNCATIMKKKTLYGLSLFLGIVFMFHSLYYYLEIYGLPSIPKGIPCEEPCSWNDFDRVCKNRKSLGNEIMCMKIYNEKYDEKSVQWQGRFESLKVGIFGTNKVIFSNMRNPDSRIVVFMNRDLNHKLEDVLPGSACDISATILSPPQRKTLLMLTLHDVNCKN